MTDHPAYMLGKVTLSHPRVRAAWDNAVRQASVEQPPKGARIEMGNFYNRCALLAVADRLEKLEAVVARLASIDAEDVDGYCAYCQAVLIRGHPHAPECLHEAAKELTKE